MEETVGLEEKHEAPKDEGKRSREKRDTKPLWWLGQRDPVVRFTAWLAVFTGLLFIVTVGSTIALLRTDWTLHQTLIAINRAWIVPRTMKLAEPLKLGNDAKFIFTFGNTGREPGTLVGRHEDFGNIKTETLVKSPLTSPAAFRDEILKIKFADSYKEAERTRYLGAIYTGAVESNYSTIIAPGKWITQEVINGLDDLIVSGCYVYETMGTTHTTKYCYFYNRSIAAMTPYPDYFNFCPTGNDPN
jgi:hypothetical protein